MLFFEFEKLANTLASVLRPRGVCAIKLHFLPEVLAAISIPPPFFKTTKHVRLRIILQTFLFVCVRVW